MQVALKEWAVVVEALAQRRQTFLLRKGGIAEGRRGFELRHHEFVFFPTWEHQQQDSIKPAYRQLFASLEPEDPEVVPFQYFAQVTDIREAPRRIEQFAGLSDFHIWADPYVRLRYEYRPDLPLLIVVVRMHRLPETVLLPNDRLYKGCRSWVELSADVSLAGAQPVEDDAAFVARRASLLAAIEQAEAEKAGRSETQHT